MMRRMGIAFLAGALAAAVIVSGGAASSQEKKECFLGAKSFAFPLRLLLESESGYRTIKKFFLFLRDGDYPAVSELMRIEGIKGANTEKRVYLVPASVITLNPSNIQLSQKNVRFIRFPGSVKIYIARKEAVYCLKPLPDLPFPESEPPEPEVDHRGPQPP